MALPRSLICATNDWREIWKKWNKIKTFTSEKFFIYFPIYIYSQFGLTVKKFVTTLLSVCVCATLFPEPITRDTSSFSLSLVVLHVVVQQPVMGFFDIVLKKTSPGSDFHSCIRNKSDPYFYFVKNKICFPS